MVADVLAPLVVQHGTFQPRLNEFIATYHEGTERFTEHDLRPRDLEQTTAMNLSWSSSLLPALRVWQLVRTGPGKLTTAALSWVTLEAAGHENAKNSQLAKVLALHAYRTEFVASYRRTVSGILSLHQSSRKLQTQVEVHARKAERLLSHSQKTNARTHLLEKAEHERVKCIRITAEADHARQTFGLASSSLEAYLGSDISGNSRDLLLRKPDKWLEILIDTQQSDRTPTTNNILLALPPEGKLNLEWAGALFSNANEAERFLVGTQQRILGLLNAMYAARNMNLHAGLHRIDGAETIDTSSVEIVGRVLEVIASWSQPSSPIPPTLDSVVNELSDRYEACLQDLRNGKCLAGESVFELTGPKHSAAQTPAVASLAN
ncbi:hypothetical protein [Arthrobacter sp. G119Y2]|uniref:hypothetical protein n=1 Tax=Arthrobacter sp. G119Y2 TaxID=3134965 RepID=UPI00311A012F